VIYPGPEVPLEETCGDLLEPHFWTANITLGLAEQRFQSLALGFDPVVGT